MLGWARSAMVKGVFVSASCRQDLEFRAEGEWACAMDMMSSPPLRIMQAQRCVVTEGATAQRRGANATKGATGIALHLPR